MQNQENSLSSQLSRNVPAILLAGMIFIVGFLVGSLWKENQILRSGALPTQAGTTATAPTAPTGPSEAQLAKVRGVSDDDHIIGSPDAEIVLIEYSDFECPFCQRFHPTTKQILAEYGDKVALVYRHYPLDFHPNAQKAGEASECVAKLGGNDAFWKFADAIFAENEKLGGKISPDAITAAIAASGVNATEAKTCLDSGEMASKVTEELAEGGAVGVTGTPATFIVTKDGAQELVNGALPYADVKATIDTYLNS